MTTPNAQARLLMSRAHAYEISAAKEETLAKYMHGKAYDQAVAYVNEQRQLAAELRAEAQQIQRGGLRDA